MGGEGGGGAGGGGGGPSGSAMSTAVSQLPLQYASQLHPASTSVLVIMLTPASTLVKPAGGVGVCVCG